MLQSDRRRDEEISSTACKTCAPRCPVEALILTVTHESLITAVALGHVHCCAPGRHGMYVKYHE